MPSPTTLSPSKRVLYRNGILLDASDFQQEQLYHRSRLALALRHLHGFGTLAGLRVEHTPAGAVGSDGEPHPPEQLKVHPGIALDRAGRLIEITEPQCLRLAKWFAFQVAQPGAVLKPFRDSGSQRFFVGDLFLRFKECPQGLRPGFPEPAADATDAIVPSRSHDGFELILAARDCDPETTLPDLPVSRFPTAPADRAALLAAIYDAYDAAPADDQDYPEDFPDKTAVFLARIRLRLLDAPNASLNRHANAEVVIDDLARPLVASSDALLHLL
jgi:hypothetical protein